MKSIQLRDHAQEVKLLPILKLKPKQHKIEFTGYCLPMDAIPLFQKLDRYIDDYLVKGKLLFVFRLIHFNTPSSKLIHLLLKRLEQHKITQNTDIEIHWYHSADDYDMQESIEEFESLVPNLSFSIFNR